MNNLSQQEEILPEIRQLSSWLPAQRKRIEQQLREMGPDAIAPLLALLEQERSKRARRVQISGCVAEVFMFATVGVFLTWLLASLLNRHWNHFPIQIIQPLYCTMFVLVGILAKPSRLQKCTARALAQCDSLETIGPLVEALGYKDKRIRPDIVAALTRLLPRLKASNYHLLTVEQKSILNQALSAGDTYQEADFLVAIIRALAQVGGQESVSQVQRWAGSYFISSSGGLRVQEAARACLPVLQARAEQERVSGTLLRPSERPETDPDALLRPATGTPDTDPEQLLRASPQMDELPPGKTRPQDLQRRAG